MQECQLRRIVNDYGLVVCGMIDSSNTSYIETASDFRMENSMDKTRTFKRRWPKNNSISSPGLTSLDGFATFPLRSTRSWSASSFEIVRRFRIQDTLR